MSNHLIKAPDNTIHGYDDRSTFCGVGILPGLFGWQVLDEQEASGMVAAGESTLCPHCVNRVNKVITALRELTNL